MIGRIASPAIGEAASIDQGAIIPDEVPRCHFRMDL
jgi:hypothetical protein